MKLAMRVIGLVGVLALGACQIEEPLLGGTVVSVMEVERPEAAEEAPQYYEDLRVPEVAWKVQVHLDGGATTTVTHTGPRRYEPGERVRLLVDGEGELLL